MSCRYFRAACNSAALVLVALPIKSQDEAALSALAVRADMENRIKFARQLIDRGRPESERNKLNDIRVTVRDTPDETHVNAYLESGFQQIDISLGFGAMLFNLIDAFQSLPPRQGIRYLKYYAETARENHKKAELNKIGLPIKSPFEWADWSETQIKEHEQDTRQGSLHDKLFTGVVTFVLSH
jgi:hypothetical protein